MTSAVTTPRPSTPEPLLRLRGISKQYPLDRNILGRPRHYLSAVDGVDLDVARGETLAVVGESGCGKSTLARLILRLIPATSGSVHYDGLDVLRASRGEIRRFRHKAQIVFQDPFGSLDPRMKVHSIVAEGMSHLGLSRSQRRERVAELLELVQLPTTLAGRFPHEFSGGQRQRISLARALAVDPEFLVADEPVSALDVSMQGEVLNLMKDLQARLGLTYLFISHDLAVVRYIADRVAVMYLGKIVEIAPADTLFSNPLHPYTQALLSSVPSLFRGDLSDRIVLEGEAPNPIDPPAACRFAGRCFRVIDRCRGEVPPLEPAGDLQPVDGSPGHLVACFNAAPLESARDRLKAGPPA